MATALLVGFAANANAASFTYDFDFTFAQTGDNDSVNGFRSRGQGGALTGFFTIDDQSIILDFGFDFEVIQPNEPGIQSARTDQVNLSSAGGDFFGTTISAAGGGVPERTTFGCSEVTGSVTCVTQAGLRRTGSQFSLSFSAFSFVPGAETVSFDARSGRATPFCNQFGGLQFQVPQSFGQIQISNGINGQLRMSAVPVPASGVLLGAAVVADGVVLRRKAGQRA